MTVPGMQTSKSWLYREMIVEKKNYRRREGQDPESKVEKAGKGQMKARQAKKNHNK